MTAEYSIDVVPDHVRADVVANNPDPAEQLAILRDLAGFYGSGGWTPARRARVAHLLRPAEPSGRARGAA